MISAERTPSFDAKEARRFPVGEAWDAQSKSRLGPLPASLCETLGMSDAMHQ